MCVYLRQCHMQILIGLAFNTDNLIKITDKSVRADELSRDNSPQTAVKSNSLYAQAAMTSYFGNQKNASVVQQRTWSRTNDSRRQVSFPPASDKISYSEVCLENTRSSMRCHCEPKPAHILREKTIRLGLLTVLPDLTISSLDVIV